MIFTPKILKSLDMIVNYFNLKENPINASIWNTIIDRESRAKYFSYTTDKGTPTNLSYASAYLNDESKSDPSDPLNILLNKFNKNLVMEDKLVAFIKFKAGSGIFPHTDDSLKRSTIFAWAVNTAPANFVPILYHDKDTQEVIDKAYYTNEGIVFNTQNMHSVEPHALDRVSLQLCFYNPIEEVYDLYKNGKLFDVA